jgi:hypothetical protein
MPAQVPDGWQAGARCRAAIHELWRRNVARPGELDAEIAFDWVRQSFVRQSPKPVKPDVEQHEFTPVDFTPDKMLLRLFKWDWNSSRRSNRYS